MLLSDLKNVTDDKACCIDAYMEHLTDTDLSQDIWCGPHGEHIQLLVTLCDVSGTVKVKISSSEFGSFISKSTAELGLLFVEDTHAAGHKHMFLDAVNENAGKSVRWVLHPRVQAIQGGQLQRHWHVTSVSGIERSQSSNDDRLAQNSVTKPADKQ
eukprot:6112033-Karenia_brevis.AAC.1